jgi:tetratricopeptide (TPR) repeat protein
MILGWQLKQYRTWVIRSFNTQLKIKPGYANAWYSKGLAFGKLGKHKQAVKCFDKVKTIAMFTE